MLSQFRKIFHITDYTSLNATDTPASIKTFCTKALLISEEYGVDGPACICVYPLLVKPAVETLKETGIKVASVAGYFPTGLAPLQLKLEEISYALDQGAGEIDMVVNRANIISGSFEGLKEEVYDAKKVCGDTILKVILESGELKDEEIRIASRISLESGADFIKTSTGKTEVGATINASKIMLTEILRYYKKTGIKKGFKVAGGISDANTVYEYYDLVLSFLGDKWLEPELFRIGASKLISNMLAEL